ncbi:translin [Candidatus Mancarchaeum acidiphilum]|uniref:Translin n=1 Tax=Candidatus Mancarchaeum acidiphilum TaxID=1920749 RepID=A0A218NNI5_9ARCH|nr:hypothetical protein [Candidatus Mancarchaeum acidiphilum]ASI14012.1 translin [Candidatus Mancarchaeum acidiphilum]
MANKEGSPIDKEIEKYERQLEDKEKLYDEISLESRDIIRGSGIAITLLHNGNKKESKDKINLLSKSVKSLLGKDSGFRYYTLQAYQEYAEAQIFYNLLINDRFVVLDEIKIPTESYILGMLDVVGELKREIISLLMSRNVKRSEQLFHYMEEIYDKTRTIRFPEVILPGFRKKQDVARIQIESAGNEIVLFKR